MRTCVRVSVDGRDVLSQWFEMGIAGVAQGGTITPDEHALWAARQALASVRDMLDFDIHRLGTQHAAPREEMAAIARAAVEDALRAWLTDLVGPLDRTGPRTAGAM